MSTPWRGPPLRYHRRAWPRSSCGRAPQRTRRRDDHLGEPRGSSIAGHWSEERGRHSPRQPQSPHARRLWRHGVRDAEPRSARRALVALQPALRGVAALHAGAARHPLRRTRLPLASVGLDRAVGDTVDGAAARGRCHDDARLRPPAPLRGRRRELPLRLQRLGVRARRRIGPVEDAARPELAGSARGGCTRPRQLRDPPLRRLEDLLPG